MASQRLAAQASEPAPIDRGELRRYEAALRTYLRRRAHPADVDDLVQEALARLISTRQDTHVATPLAYLFRIAANLLADHAHARRRLVFEPCSTEIEESVATPPEQELGTHLADLQAAYAETLAELSPRCRAVFVMRRHQGKSVTDIADELGISRRMVWKYMAQALELLSERLQPFLGTV